MKHTLLTVSAFLIIGNALFQEHMLQAQFVPENIYTLSEAKMGMDNRAMPGSLMAEVMRDNILLTIAYMRGIVPDRSHINWDEVRKPFEYNFTLMPGEVFTYQKDALPEYADSVAKTIEVNYGYSDGFKYDGYLVGDGVCHLSSLLYKAAKQAGVHAYAPTNHDFMSIPDVARQYGVSIYSMPGQPEANAMQNLYIKNDKTVPIEFQMKYDGTTLSIKVVETMSNASIPEVII